jgi:hypothetical protein
VGANLASHAEQGITGAGERVSDDVDAGQHEHGRWARRLARFYAHRVTRVLVVVVTVVALPWSTYDVYRFFANRHAIDSACAGLVPAGKVADLPYSGGRISHNRDSISLDDLSGRCMIYSTEAGEATDSSSGERLFFSAGVYSEPSKESTSPIRYLGDLLGPYSPYLDSPLGGGVPGRVTADGVTVKLDCDVPSRGVKEIVAGADSALAGYGPLVSGHQVDQDTRHTLASIAVTMANRLAGKLGCENRLPTAPQHVPAVHGELVPASEADGTCAWYGKSLASGLGDDFEGFPDRVVETSVDNDVWTETCGLTLTPKRTRALWAGAYGGKPKGKRVHPPEGKPAEWWSATQSFFGETAQNVEIDGLGPDQPLAPGTAGHNEEESVWWASSQCPDGPAIHTLTLGYPYERVAASHFRPVFRAYVEDVAERRGCKDVTFPDQSEFPPAGDH